MDAISIDQQRQNVSKTTTELPFQLVSNEFKNLSVLGLVADMSACGYYRVILPLHMFKQHGAKVTTTSIQNISDFLNHDIIVAPRQHSEDIYEVIRMMKWEGKGGTYTTKILTPTGWTTFKDIKVGDRVIGSNGKSCSVTGRFERGVLPTYRVTFADHTSVLCDGEHLWHVVRKSQRATQKKVEIIPTNQLISEKLRPKGNCYNFHIPLVKPVEFDKQDPLPIDPYILGTILGDGAISARNFYICSDNLNIVDEINKVLPDYMYTDVHPDRQFYRTSIKAKVGIKNPYRDALKTLGLKGTKSGTKFIPECYLHSSPEERLSIIQGLMDTDGTVTRGSQRQYTTVSKDLADGFSFLVRSLGGITTTFYRKAYTIIKNEVEKTYQASYIVAPNLPNHFKLFRVKQYKDIFPRREPCKAIESIALEGEEPIVCISVDAKDNLYVTDDFIVTHNSVAFELDDDLDAVLPSSPAYVTYHKGSPELKTMDKIISACDGMTVTTPEIARWYSRLNRNISIVGNYIDLSLRDWACDCKWIGGKPLLTPKPVGKPEKWGNKIVVGYSGGSTHGDDLQQLGPQIKKLLDERDDCIFVMYTSIETIQQLVQKYQWPVDKVDYIPARHFMDHPGGLHGIDIGLAPLIPCQFNNCKSHLKILEYFSVGSAVITSNVGPYARFTKMHPGYILTIGEECSNFKSWYSAITYLLDNPEELQRMKSQGRKLVYDHYSLEKNFRLWAHAWTSITKNVDKGICGPPDKILPLADYKSFGKAGINDPCPCGVPINGKRQVTKRCCGVHAF